MTDALDRLRAALVDRYAIERELGSGGIATVYLARDLKHDRQARQPNSGRRTLMDGWRRRSTARAVCVG